VLLEALERQRDFLVCSSQLVRGPAHGYELLEQLPELIGERMDTGNLYRFLRLLEAEGIVRSQWEDDVAGPSKRTYELTRPRQDGEKPQAPVALRSRLS
jgi:DNA-binding PadR family transcriptional regulator